MIDLTTDLPVNLTADCRAWVRANLEHLPENVDFFTGEFESAVEDVVDTAVGFGEIQAPLFTAPEGCSIYTDVIRDGDSLAAGFRFILSPPFEQLAGLSLATEFIDTKNATDDREALGENMLVAILTSAAYYLHRLVQGYLAITASR